MIKILLIILIKIYLSYFFLFSILQINKIIYNLVNYKINKNIYYIIILYNYI